jgi:hypothetical protein
MLWMVLTYHDALYLVTELGLLSAVLLLCWLVPRFEHHSPGHS